MDPIAIQKSVKDNAEDVATYLRDLRNWEANIKKKDAELRGVDIEEEKLYPEIRSKYKKDKNEIETFEKKKKISGFDYESWDKLDVEKVCEEIDFNEAEKIKKAAVYEKEKGNSHVKDGNWQKAIDCYSKAIKIYPKDAIFFANRAHCYLQLKDFQKAKCDCDEALRLDSSYAKAWMRRSAAWEGLGNMQKAIRDLESMLSIEPQNKRASSKLKALKAEILMSKQNQEKGCGDGSGNTGETNSVGGEFKFDGDLPWKDYKGEIIQPIYKPPHRRSKKPLRRVPVLEVQINEPVCPGGARDLAPSKVETGSSDKSSIPCNLPAKNIEIETSEPPPSELPPAPKTSVQFLMNWKNIKMHPDMALMYLQQIPPESLPSVFGDSLEISVLEEMLSILGQKVIKSSPVENPIPRGHHSIYEFMKHLCKVPRFSTLAMFLNEQEQNVSRQILASCVENNECTAEEAAKLAEIFFL
ncbi:RNA polymerase II-associated protein 3-like isoform X2 [Ischnura elegans]|uniref:RNA polymerase II-associated protein 3-like isoform X2 n=1 Tax=Ischnura elegans TaxID=197161 RepID=UPI001ED8B463|nr:RNA polymerase II-associated protein 3-like isoform X2 [Ischnura elegans]